MTEERPLRILVAESALDTRLSDALAAGPSAEIAAIATDGFAAVRLTQRLQPDAVVMTRVLPGIDGLEATRRIMSVSPTPIVLATERDPDDGAAEARQAGALGTVAMPPPAGTPRFAESSGRLIAAVHAMARVKLVRRTLERPRRADGAAGRHADRHIKIVAIAASTGGPAALRRIFALLPDALPVPVVITQHISSGFVAGLVDWLDAAGPIAVKLAAAGEALRPGVAYVAPDDRHLTLTRERSLAIDDGPPIDGHRPSATAMFRSVADAYGAGSLGVILSGMGRDGVAGLGALHRAGGTVWAQDEASSAVFGMPQAAIDAGVADLVLPLDAIAVHLAAATAAPR